jgi:hypothetical protein
MQTLASLGQNLLMTQLVRQKWELVSSWFLKICYAQIFFFHVTPKNLVKFFYSIHIS